MRTIKSETISEAVKDLCIKANYFLPEDVKASLHAALKAEPFPVAKDTLGIIVENYTLAENEFIPICQDTGLACVFVELGQDVHILGNIEKAINEGVRQGYETGLLRKSCVSDPLRRINTNDNTPAMIYYDIVPGENLKITVAPKGFGSENMSQLKMLKPSDGIDGVIDFVIKVVEEAGPNPCPPIVVGVGIGGTFDKAALLAKKALLRELSIRNDDIFYSDLESVLLEKINALGIGPQGFGGKSTALAVNIEVMPTHIAGLPCAVNINCHATRHVSLYI